jgi:hypothetical protein
MKLRNFFWGIFFILAAAFVIVSQVYPGNLFKQISIWTIIVSVFLVAIIIKSISELNYFGIFVPIAILYTIFDTPLSLPDISFWKLILAAALLSIGCEMLFRKHRCTIKYHNTHDHVCGHDGETLTGNQLYAKVSFCDSSKYLHSDSLEKGEFAVSFGHLNVYFDQVQLSPDGAEVYLDCSFGEMDVYLPRHWQVKDKLHATLGNISNTSRPFADITGPQITLIGEAKFGAINIHYV